MKRLLTCVAAASAVALATGVQAQEAMDRPGPSRFDLGLYAGGSVTSSWFRSRLVTVSGGEVTGETEGESYKPGYAPIGGVQATFWATPELGLRAHGAYAPMRVPFSSDGAFDVFGEEVGDRSTYTLNTWIYDLELMLRPWARREGWTSGVYFWAGGGGLTTDAAGDGGGSGCERTQLVLGACLPYERDHATVGQGTAGAGMDLIRITRSLGLFGELGFHAYDSPVHVGDGWLPPATVPPGGTARVSDDRVAVTTRLVAGLKLMLGGREAMAPVVIPPPIMEPAPMPVAPPADEMRAVRVCVVEGGQLREVDVDYNVTRGDTMVAGRPFREAYPSTTGYAAGATWFINSDVVTLGEQRYVKFGLPRVVGVNELTRISEYQGVSVFAEPGAAGGSTPDVIYVPVRTGCEVQPYQKEVKVRNVRG